MDRGLKDPNGTIKLVNNSSVLLWLVFTHALGGHGLNPLIYVNVWWCGGSRVKLVPTGNSLNSDDVTGYGFPSGPLENPGIPGKFGPFGPRKFRLAALVGPALFV